MKKLIALLIVVVVFTSCNSKKKNLQAMQTDIHKITVQEVVQVSGYTYLRAQEDGVEKWVAAPTIQAEVGKTYYFKKGLEMPNFESKELNKTFETIYFVDQISEDQNSLGTMNTNSVIPESTEQNIKPVIEKETINIEASKDVTTIGNLFKDFKSFDGKTIKVKGKVTKFNAAIMNKNWIHVQDGTDFNGDFDLTITSMEEVKVGDIITLEGKVTLNKDFGAGYSYKVIVEDAVLIK